MAGLAADGPVKVVNDERAQLVEAIGNADRKRHGGTTPPGCRWATPAVEARKCLSCTGNLGLRSLKVTEWKALRR